MKPKAKQCNKPVLYILLAIFCTINIGMYNSDPPGIAQLSAPALGVTSSAVLLILKDNFVPEFKPNGTMFSREYLVYRDSVEVGRPACRTRSSLLKNIYFKSVNY